MSAGANPQLRRRHLLGTIFEWACATATFTCLIVLIVLILSVASKGLPRFGWTFLTSKISMDPAKAGILMGITGSFWLILFASLITIPIGVGAAIYLEEYSRKNWLTSTIQLNISNLASVPSIVYGVLGLTAFYYGFGLYGSKFPSDPVPHLPFGDKLITGALTLSLLVLPVVIVGAQEALRSIPPSIRFASHALGATKWQTIWYQVLPPSLPGIMTAAILAMSRAIGEAAPLIVVGAATHISWNPGGINGPVDLLTRPGNLVKVPFDQYSAMPIVIFEWASQPQPEFHKLAAAGIIALVVILLAMNSLAVFIRYRFERLIRW